MKKQVGNTQNSGLDVASAHCGDVIVKEPSILLAEKTVDYHELSASLHGVAVHNEAMETDNDGGLGEEGSESPRLSVTPEPLPHAEYRLPELYPCAMYRRPKRWLFSTYDSNTKWSAPFFII